MGHYLEDLNEQQRIAVTHIDGPLMIIAGAGSGKTKVLTSRIAHLIASGIKPGQILALTFTTKAAKEMQGRIFKLLPPTVSPVGLFVGTFHSIFCRILKVEGHQLGYPQNFTIYDTDDSKQVIKYIIKELSLSDEEYNPKDLYSRISSLKNMFIQAHDYVKDKELTKIDELAKRPLFYKIYQYYTQYCFRNGALDFDDLLLKTYELFTKHPACRERYQKQFQYVLIDEYQDTNKIQYLITNLIASISRNICVVGDDAQSIYGFRGATIENILKFAKDYPETKIVKLEQNYRSTGHILQTANAVIANNQSKIDKKLWSNNELGDKIKIVQASNEYEEAKIIADKIQEQALRYHYGFNEFAILYRNNRLSRSLEDSLRHKNIPYKIYGGTSFYQRSEVKDFLAYIKFITNKNDVVSLLRIINYPTRGIGLTSINTIQAFAQDKQIPLYECLKMVKEIPDIKPSTAVTITNFINKIDELATIINEVNAYRFTIAVEETFGIAKSEINKIEKNKDATRYENMRELINSTQEFVELRSADDSNAVGITNYLEEVSLLTNEDNDNQPKPTVKLMTIHASKGLEFPVVFIVGVEEGLLPSHYQDSDLEEERRLFYVAITRSKQKLFLSFATSRRNYSGNAMPTLVSRFISEIPEEYLDKSMVGYASSGNYNAPNRVVNSPKFPKKYEPYPKKIETKHTPQLINTIPKSKPIADHIPSPNFTPSSPQLITEGQKIEHQKIGYGTVLKIENPRTQPIALINFEIGGEKRIMLQYAKIRIVQ
ncbi:MAG: 3'-5' exonuclease [Phycisphaerales bacterium]|nr:3'-5' exonuclease [Phycisphaerales bacterium]